MRILSFDPGLANTGYASLEVVGGVLRLGKTWGVLHTKPSDGDERVRIDILNAEICRLLGMYRPDAVGIEDWSYMGRKGKNESSMPALIENIRGLCKELKIPTYIYPNPEWKKVTLGIRSADKAQVKHYVGKKLPDAKQVLHRIPDHVWDSVGICFAVHKQHT